VSIAAIIAFSVIAIIGLALILVAFGELDAAVKGRGSAPIAGTAAALGLICLFIAAMNFWVGIFGTAG